MWGRFPLQLAGVCLACGFYHRYSNLCNRKGIHPCACVSMYVKCSGFKMDAISGDVRTKTPTKHMVFVACGMAQEEMAFSLLESFDIVLHKLADKNLLVSRHSAIWRQIQSLFGMTCLNQNFQNLSSFSYSFQIAT